MTDAIASVLNYIVNPVYWLTVFAGLTLATVAGIVPGVTATQIMALTFPFIVLNVHDPVIGIVLLATITGTANTFNSIPAMFFGMVEGGAQVTFLEGHQLVRRGQGAFAMGAVYAVSAIGGLVGATALLLVLPLVRPFIMQFSFSEIAALGLFGLAMVAILSRGAMVKGLASAAMGLLLGAVGTQSYTGTDRFTFGMYDLELGLPLVAVILGVMAIPEMLDLTVTREPVATSPGDISTREIWRGFREGLRRWKMAVRQSIFGSMMGTIPGMGSTVITWMAYGFGMAFSRDRSQFGKGSLDGLLFAESAENAKEGGQAIPTLVLGIPGSAGWVLVLVAIVFYGIVPGPDMLTSHLDIIGLIVFTLAIGNLFLTLIGLFVTGPIIRLTRIPYPAIGAALIPITLLGAYFSEQLVIVFPIVLIFTIVGLLMKRYRWPRPPFVLGLVMGPIIENNLWSAINLNGIGGVITRPLTLILVLVTVGAVAAMHVAMNRADAAQEAAVKVARESEDIVIPEAEHQGLAAGEKVQAILHYHLEGQTAIPDLDATVGEVAPSPSPGAEGERRRRWRLDTETLFAIGLMVVAAWAFLQALSYTSNRASMFPLLSSAILFLLAGVTAVSVILGRHRSGGQIMDLGLLSAGSPEARRTVLLTAGAFVVYALVMLIVGLQFAGVAFALLLPLLIMPGRNRWKVSLASALVVLVFTFGIGDQLQHISWPEPILQTLLSNGGA